MARSNAPRIFFVCSLLLLAGLAYIGYSSGLFARFQNKPEAPAPAPNTTSAAPTMIPRGSQGSGEGKSDNIFGIGGNTHDTAVAPRPATPPASPAVLRPTAPSAAPGLPSVSAMSLGEARAKVDAVTMEVEKSLAHDPAYMQAKADVAAADSRRKAALEISGSGSPEVQAASQAWVDAKTRLRKLVEAAASKNPAFQSAQRALADAQANLRASKK